jgi:hypothetical protein
MKKLAISLLIAIATILNAESQNLFVSGKITNQQNSPLFGANIVLQRFTDSLFIKGAVTDINGNFTIQNVSAGKYIIRVSYIGYDNLFLDKTINAQSLALGTILLNEKAAYLKSLDVKDKLLTSQLKGDTSQYNAGAFKTNPDANAEDLVNKMPGITSQDNKVQAQNEDVKKVLVNGKPFFGDDPNAVLKNIPAEIIDKIQVYDEKSDQSQFTGFDDGNTSKTINIITKTQFSNGTFGKVYGGYGFNDKWKGGFNLNFFKNNRRITILAQSNNINDQNFTSEDLLGITSTGGGKSGRGGSGGHGGGSPQYGQDNGSNSFLVDQKGGINTTNSFGINYVDKWKNVDFSGSYFLNYTDNNSISDLFRQYVTQSNSGMTYTEKSNNCSTNYNHRLNMKINWKIDSLNSILVQPKLSIQQNDGVNSLSGQNQQADSLLSSTSNNYSSNLTGMNFTAPLLYRHSFNKKRRSFSVSITPGYNQSKGNSNLNSFAYYYYDTFKADSLEQLANLDKQGIILSSSISYTEPVSAKGQLLFTYGTNYNKSASDKETYNFSKELNDYTLFDSTLSNKFNSAYFAQSIGTSYRYQETKWNFNAGLSYQQAKLSNEQVFPFENSLSRTFYSVLPNAMFQYKFSLKKNLRISYRSSNTAPNVSQLQNVINNTNSLQLSSGNPDLTQNWQNNLNVSYNSVNTVKSTAFFALLSGTLTQNYISNGIYIASHDSVVSPGIILSEGSQFTMPVNLDGYYGIRSFLNYSFTIPKIKSNLSLNFGGTFTSSPGLINNDLNKAISTNAGLGFVLSSNISEKIDFTISSNSTYNTISNTLQADRNSSYFNQNTKFKIQLMPTKSLVVQTDLNHQYYSGLSQNFNQNYLLWNAAIGYKFLKSKLAEIRLSVYDILKQNNSITRNTTESYYEDIQTNVLQRYLMLTFTYNLKYFTTSGETSIFKSGNKNHTAN